MTKKEEEKKSWTDNKYMNTVSSEEHNRAMHMLGDVLDEMNEAKLPLVAVWHMLDDAADASRDKLLKSGWNEDDLERIRNMHKEEK